MTASGGADVQTGTQGSPGIPGDLSKLKSNGELIETIDAAGHPAALGLDPASKALFVIDQRGGEQSETPATLLQFSASGEELAAFGLGEVNGAPRGNALAFEDAAKRLYVISQTGNGQIFAMPEPGPLPASGSTGASGIRKTTATLKAEINPEGKATTYRFQYIGESQFEKNEAEGKEGFAGAEETTLSASIGEDFSFDNVSAQPTGLTPATSYRVRVIAFNSNNSKGVDGETVTFETLPPALVDGSAAEVTATSAKLLAEVDPLGEATSYRFQYISSEAMRHNEETGEASFTGASFAPGTEVSIGSGKEPVSVFQYIQGLSPHTIYRYRVVVVNASDPGGFGSPTLSFTTQAPAVASALPDGRQWELVSPPNKHGALLLSIGSEELIQAAASGDAITYLATSPTEAEPQGFASVAQVLSRRGAGGWASRDLSVARTEATGLAVGKGYEYRFFSPDLSLGVLQPVGAFEPALSSEASEQTPYLRKDFGAGPSAFCAESCYQPLLTSEDVTSGAPFGGCPSKPVECGATFVGASPDLSHVVLESGIGLTSTVGDRGGLYEYTEKQLRLVSVLPNGTPLEAKGSPALGHNTSTARGAISADGSRVFWSESQNHLYLRYNAMQPQSATGTAGECTEAAKACTLQLDAVQGGAGGPSQAVFQFASENGSTVYFTDTQALTSDAGANSAQAEPDLYECHIVEEAGRLRCALTDLTPLTGGKSADVRGSLVGASADGSYAYFVANGALAPGARVGNCAGSVGACSLYLRHEGRTTFVAALSGDDESDWAGDLTKLTARVSPDGRWLAFVSDRSLTGYDNRDAVYGKPDEEVFLYHAAANGAEGKLICASCNPTGARPHGVEYIGSIEPSMPVAGGSRLFGEGQGVAANIPGWTAYSLGLARYQSRYLSDSGRLFFDSRDALVPQDTNGTEDVYEYEPPQGEGAPPNDSCSESDPGYVPAAAGCVSLISSGASPEESAFLDASESGNDVFFLTGSRLSTLDTDGATDVYDAHVCTSESPCPPPPPPPPPSCQGDACQAPATAPEVLTPSSLSFAGPGDVVPLPPVTVTTKTKPLTRAQKLAKALRTCRKQKAKRKRAACEKQARRAYGATAKAKRSSKGAGK
ncbi:MAG TPA: hypothetical protein VGP18_01320 [Solirubrobacteraceae bacterium]|jgi:hypothetical protein|nr:hypothetical protein [Solirubrobacteraceae bacterium]